MENKGGEGGDIIGNLGVCPIVSKAFYTRTGIVNLL